MPCSLTACSTAIDPSGFSTVVATCGIVVDVEPVALFIEGFDTSSKTLVLVTIARQGIFVRLSIQISIDMPERIMDSQRRFLR